MANKTERLAPDRVRHRLGEIPKWESVRDHHLVRRFRFPDFLSALDFVNRVGHVAEERQHHPDVLLGWGKVEITIWTHSVDGLTDKDFDFALAVDRLGGESEPS
jgi:4a-hydroxytetrahydrobiopterin dehydratase